MSSGSLGDCNASELYISPIVRELQDHHQNLWHSLPEKIAQLQALNRTTVFELIELDENEKQHGNCVSGIMGTNRKVLEERRTRGQQLEKEIALEQAAINRLLRSIYDIRCEEENIRKHIVEERLKYSNLLEHRNMLKAQVDKEQAKQRNISPVAVRVPHIPVKFVSSARERTKLSGSSETAVVKQKKLATGKQTASQLPRYTFGSRTERFPAMPIKAGFAQQVDNTDKHVFVENSVRSSF